MDTIFALSSGSLPSGVAIIRLSGKEVPNILQKLCGTLPKPRMMHYGTLTAQNGEILDETLAVYFKNPHSFTGEDCAEFHLHGGKAVVLRFLEELSLFNHCRQAEAGEFSKRAFGNGKLDLSQAEGLADLIEAETESQRRLAVMGASGKLAKLYRKWRQKLLQSRAFIEAELDFADESDVPGSISHQIWQEIALLENSIHTHIIESERAAKMRDGLKIVLVGAPNAGKSSIINRLAGRDVAIVTEEAGTTRDALEVRLILAGMPILITDTAGLRKTNNAIEKIGIKKAKERILEADLVLYIEDMQDPQKVILPKTQANIWHIGNKVDIYYKNKTLKNKSISNKKRWPIQFSAKNGEGFDEFLKLLNDFCHKYSSNINHMVTARQRQLLLLKECNFELEQARKLEHLDLSLRAEHLRRAADSLGKITGDMDVEDILDIIFSEFCIGK